MSQPRAVVGAEQFDPGGRRVGLDAEPVAAADEGVLHKLPDGRLQVGGRPDLEASSTSTIASGSVPSAVGDGRLHSRRHGDRAPAGADQLLTPAQRLVHLVSRSAAPVKSSAAVAPSPAARGDSPPSTSSESRILYN